MIATDLAKLLLSLTMLLTFPLPFFTSREILIISFLKGGANGYRSTDDTDRPLIVLERDANAAADQNQDEQHEFLLPGQGNQLRLVYHVLLTVALWMLLVSLAISAPSLGDVLDLVGCASGTLIAFVLPGLFSLQIKGYSTEGALLLGIGGVVGTIGTICSLWHLLEDMF
jgi:hypothetical protein